jgi:hypothetical protein
MWSQWAKLSLKFIFIILVFGAVKMLRQVWWGAALLIYLQLTDPKTIWHSDKLGTGYYN